MQQLYEVVTTYFASGNFKYLAMAFLIGSIFVDISPRIKFNPWKFILGKIGKYINNSIETEIAGFKKDVYEKIDALGEEQQTQFESIQKEQKLQADTLQNLIVDLKYKELSRLRWEVSNFATTMEHGTKYPREQYRHIIDEADKFLREAKNPGNGIIINPEDILEIEEIKDRVVAHYNKYKEEQPTLFMI